MEEPLRKIGAGAPCTYCGSKDTMVDSVKREKSNYPSHLADRFRYHKCGSCKRPFKTSG